MPRRTPHPRRWLIALTAPLLALAAACGSPEAPPPLTIGHLADFSGPFRDQGTLVQSGVALAVTHVNQAGGVLGQPVRLVTGDTAADPAQAVAEARRLLQEEGVHAIVGPPTSAATLALVDLAVAARLPLISPSATAPALTTADDDGFLFRTIGSDAVQGIVLAQLADRVAGGAIAVLYRDDAWGRGLHAVFAAHYGGALTAVAYPPTAQPSYLAELRQAARGGASVLLTMGFGESATLLGEAIAHDLFARFLLTDGNRNAALLAQVGAAPLEGALGTAAGSDPTNPATQAWNTDYVAAHGALPAEPFVREGYDAAIAIALAAQAAGTTDGGAIRDQLRRVAGPPGPGYLAGAAGVTEALAAAARGAALNYEGAASPIDWDAAGDIPRGVMEIFTVRDGRFETLEIVPFDLTAPAAPVPPATDPPPDVGGLACLQEQLAGSPAGERIGAVLTGADPTGAGLTLEESAALGQAVEACGIETEFEFPEAS